MKKTIKKQIIKCESIKQNFFFLLVNGGSIILCKKDILISYIVIMMMMMMIFFRIKWLSLENFVVEFNHFQKKIKGYIVLSLLNPVMFFIFIFSLLIPLQKN